MKWRLPGWLRKRPRAADDDLAGEMKWRVRAWRDPDESPKQFLDLERLDLVGEDFSGRRLDQLYVDGSRFRDCRFERMVVGSAESSEAPTTVWTRCTRIAPSTAPA